MRLRRGDGPRPETLLTGGLYLCGRKRIEFETGNATSDSPHPTSRTRSIDFGPEATARMLRAEESRLPGCGRGLSDLGLEVAALRAAEPAAPGEVADRGELPLVEARRTAQWPSMADARPTVPRSKPTAPEHRQRAPGRARGTAPRRSTRRPSPRRRAATRGRGGRHRANGSARPRVASSDCLYWQICWVWLGTQAVAL